MKITSKDEILNNKDLIGFAGATWTILVYMLNRQSPKKILEEKVYNFRDQDDLIKKIIWAQKLHIKKQVEKGASIIQVFDSWAGLLPEQAFERW